MKRHLLLFLSVFCEQSSFAQKNRISITENNIFYENYRTVRNDSLQSGNAELKFKDKIFFVEPSIGFYRFVRSNIALGIDFGMIRLNYKTDDSYQIDHNFQSRTGRQYRNGVSLNLNVMERFVMKKYLFTTAVSLSLEWIYKAGDGMETTNINDISQPEPIYSTTTTTDRKQFTFGLYFKGGIHRALYKNLYLGVVLNMGLRREHHYGEYISITKASNNFDSKVIIDYQKFNAITKDLFGSFVLSYFF